MANSVYNSILQQAGLKNAVIKKNKTLSGGCIHNVVALFTNQGNFCIKTNNANALPMFTAEAHGLSALANQNVINTPKVYKSGTVNGVAFLLLSYLEPAPQQPNFWQTFGQQLAQLHLDTKPYFGFDQNNYIGALPQQNHHENTAADFFINQRLKPQLQLAQQNGYIDRSLNNKFNEAFKRIEQIIPNHIKPGLVHGDLWSGNFITGPNGQVALIDPAAHYGNYEAEMAFTTMFGGFDTRFYDAYYEVKPLAAGYQKRFDIYNIYNYLVHVNLFGSSYMKGVQTGLNAVFSY